MPVILIVDDNDDDRRMLSLLLSTYTDYQVIEATGGREALPLAARASLILLDVMMPGMDGIEAFQHLREDPKTSDIPIIFMTAYPQAIKERLSPQALGTIDYLVKPIDKDQLLNRLNLLIGIRKARSRFREKKFSEADQLTLLLSAIEQIGDGITVTDREGKWIMFNHTQAFMFGYSTTDMSKLTAPDLYDPASSHRLQNDIIPDLDNLGHWEGELTGKKKDGRLIPVLLSLSTVKDYSGNFLGIMGITKDISALKKAYSDLEKAQEVLVHSERLKALGEMVGGIAHEFNNLLSGILGNAQLLLPLSHQPVWTKRLRAIERAAINGAEAVKRLQIFTLSSVSLGDDQLDIKQLIEEALQLTRPRWRDISQKKGIQISVERELQEVPSIRGDEKATKMALINILVNAIDALDKGGKIKVKNWADSDYLHIQIIDNGIGMSFETKDRVFEPYFTTQRPLKSGLGLSVAYGTVKKQGGDIEIESKLGEGTTVTVHLKLAPLKPSLPTEEQGEKAGARKNKILVIDDDPDILDILGEFLSQDGYRVTNLSDPEEGLRQALSENFDLVITDLAMDKLNGLELARKLKQKSPSTPVALITGWDSISPEEIKQAGLDAIWPKPFKIKQILEQIKTLLTG